MGTKGREIVKLDVDMLIGKLNQALADEWYAYYQYWVGSKVLKGPMKDAVAAELIQHAADELRHADMLAMRIIQLGGTPVLHPDEWKTVSGCGYAPPTDAFVAKILAQNIRGEQCAIGTYSELLDLTLAKDPVTYQMAVEILKDEIEHEEDLQALQDDLKMLR